MNAFGFFLLLIYFGSALGGGVVTFSRSEFEEIMQKIGGMESTVLTSARVYFDEKTEAITKRIDNKQCMEAQKDKEQDAAIAACNSTCAHLEGKFEDLKMQSADKDVRISTLEWLLGNLSQRFDKLEEFYEHYK